MKPVLNFDNERRQSPNGYRVRQVGVIVKGRATRAEAAALSRLPLNGFGEGENARRERERLAR